MSDAIREALVATEPGRFTSEWLLEGVPFVFGGDRAGYIGWRTELGGLIGIDPCCLYIVGSAAFGFSMDPKKNMPAFHAKSDIDVAVVSPFLFDVAWEQLRAWGARRLAVPKAARFSLEEHKTRLIFWGTIATDYLIQYMPFGKQWITAFGTMADHDPTKDRDIKARIYRDVESLRLYQLIGIRKAKAKLLATEG